MGRAFVLFPLSGLGLSNPLQPGARHRLPGTITEEGSEKTLRWSVDTVGGKETFLIIASREPLDELERALETVMQARTDSPVEVNSTLVARLRGIGTVIKKDAPPSESVAGGAAVSESLKRLSRRASAGDIWIQEIVLENPGN